MKATPSRLTQMQSSVIQPSSDQIVNNSAVFVNDSALTVSLEANAKYIVEVHAVFSSTSSTPDVQTKWAVPVGVTGNRMCIGPTSVSASIVSETDAKGLFKGVPFSGAITYQLVASALEFCQEYAYIAMGSTAGSVTFQWTQAVATSATNTIRKASSFMLVQRFA